MTDNKNRAVAEVRRYFTKHGGNLGENGCVSWLFTPKGVISVPAEGQDPDKLFEMAVESGAEDVQIDETIDVYTASEDFEAVRTGLEQAGVRMESADLKMIPSTWAEVDEKTTLQAMKLIEDLEDLDDVQNVYSNLYISDDLLEKYEAA